MQQNHLTDQLKHAGLTDKEALIYSSLLELGGSGFPSAIAEKAGIKRSTAYKILLGLNIKGLVNEIEKRNKIYYQVEKPEKLVRYAKQQVQFSEDNLERAEKLFPELQGMYALSAQKPKVLFFEGRDEVNSIYTDCITDQKPYEMLAIGNAKAFKASITEKEIRHFVSQKAKLGITTRGVVPDTAEDRAYNQNVFTGIEKKYWPNMRFIDEKLFPFESEITIYGKNKVAVTKFGNNNVIGVIIEDEVIHGMMRMVFELAWKGCEK